MEQPIHEEQYKGFTIKIIPDCDAENPRDFCEELGTMVTKHNRYSLGDEQTDDFQTWLEEKAELSDDQLENLWEKHQDAECFHSNQSYREYMESLIEKAFKNSVFLPLYLYDHSGITMNTTGFSCSWDSGQVGFIYADYEDIRKEYGWKNITKKRIKEIEKRLTSEVKEYDDYLTGNVYGFVIEDKDGEHIDSCWNFIGDYEYCLSEARHAVKAEYNYNKKQRFERLKTLIKNHVPLNMREKELQTI